VSDPSNNPEQPPTPEAAERLEEVVRRDILEVAGLQEIEEKLRSISGRHFTATPLAIPSPRPEADLQKS
jgi:hypothetical protein